MMASVRMKQWIEAALLAAQPLTEQDIVIIYSPREPFDSG
jgi:hypothetical protein